MPIVKVTQKGDFKNTEKLLKKSLGRNYKKVLDKYGRKGVEALALATPMDTGETAASWYYDIIQNGSSLSVIWSNAHIEGGYANIALLLQLGHGTKNGGYVQGIDYINPALKPIFDALAKEAWNEVTKV